MGQRRKLAAAEVSRDAFSSVVVVLMNLSKGSFRSEGFWFFSADYLRKTGIIPQMLRKLRRSYFSVFRRSYVKENLERRQGDCNRCGACCELVYKCPFVARDKDELAYCRVYGTFQPASCRNYPFDEVDSEVEVCSFSFAQPGEKK
jgi:hypothetical protein